MLRCAKSRYRTGFAGTKRVGAVTGQPGDIGRSVSEIRRCGPCGSDDGHSPSMCSAAVSLVFSTLATTSAELRRVLMPT